MSSSNKQQTNKLGILLNGSCFYGTKFNTALLNDATLLNLTLLCWIHSFIYSLASHSPAALRLPIIIWPPWIQMISLIVTLCSCLKGNINLTGLPICFRNVSVFTLHYIKVSVCSVSSFITPVLAFAQYISCEIYSSVYLFVQMFACAQSAFVYKKLFNCIWKQRWWVRASKLLICFCACVNAASHHTLRYFNTTIDQLQQHPDQMIPDWVTGSMRVWVYVWAKDKDGRKEWRKHHLISYLRGRRMKKLNTM